MPLECGDGWVTRNMTVLQHFSLLMHSRNLFVPLLAFVSKLVHIHNALTISIFFHHSSVQNSNRGIALAIYTYIAESITT